jgi:hypothetical protein
MFKTRFFAVAALASAAFVSTPALAAGSPVIGSWTIATQTQMGTFKATMTVSKGADGAYTVDIKDQPMEGGAGGPPGGGAPPTMTISDVKVDGSDFSFTRSIASDQFSMDLKYKGTVDGDKLSATASSDFGDSDVTGSRIDE